MPTTITPTTDPEYRTAAGRRLSTNDHGAYHPWSPDTPDPVDLDALGLSPLVALAEAANAACKEAAAHRDAATAEHRAATHTRPGAEPPYSDAVEAATREHRAAQARALAAAIDLDATFLAEVASDRARASQAARALAAHDRAVEALAALREALAERESHRLTLGDLYLGTRKDWTMLHGLGLGADTAALDTLGRIVATYPVDEIAAVSA